MKFNFGRFGTEGNKREIHTPEDEVEELKHEPQPEEPDEVNTSRRNFIIGTAAAVAGSTLLGGEAEAARLPGESNRDYIERSRREHKERRERRSEERSAERTRIPDDRYGTRRNQQPEGTSRVETKGDMTYVGFQPTPHEEKLLGIRLYHLVPDAASIQINLITDRELGTQNLQMSIIRNNGFTLKTVGKPVFTDRNPDKNLLLINRLLERLAEQVGSR